MKSRRNKGQRWLTGRQDSESKVMRVCHWQFSRSANQTDCEQVMRKRCLLVKVKRTRKSRGAGRWIRERERGQPEQQESWDERRRDRLGVNDERLDAMCGQDKLYGIEEKDEMIGEQGAIRGWGQVKWRDKKMTWQEERAKTERVDFVVWATMQKSDHIPLY